MVYYIEYNELVEELYGEEKTLTVLARLPRKKRELRHYIINHMEKQFDDIKDYIEMLESPSGALITEWKVSFDGFQDSIFNRIIVSHKINYTVRWKNGVSSNVNPFDSFHAEAKDYIENEAR